MTLSHKTIENLQPCFRLYRKTDADGLAIVVYPTGKKTWQFRYKYAKKSKTLCFGAFPDVGLSDARVKAAQARLDIKNDIDPAEAKKTAKRLAIMNAENTFAALATEWHERYKETWNKKHAENIIARLKRDAFPLIGSTPIADLRAVDFSSVVRIIEDRGALETARRVLQSCSQIMRYAVQTGRAEIDYTTGLRGMLKHQTPKHYASIKVNQLPDLVCKIRHNDTRLFKQTRNALEMMLLTFVRTSELINARWVEFDLQNGMWVIPAERMKMRKEHQVPLSRQVIRLLMDQMAISGNREHVFPGIPHPRKPMSNATLLRALDRMGYKKIMTGHGFRALAATALQENLNYDYKYVDRQLAHQHKSRVRQAYDRTEFLDKRKKMMQDWADYIDRIYKEAI